MNNLKFQDESTEFARAHINTYQNGINDLQQKYADEDNESTYE